jgi:dienelactone hydrolase
MLTRPIPASAWLSLFLLAGLPLGQLTADPPKLRDLDSHCPFTPPTDLGAWEQRAKDLRLQLDVSQGLWPKPELDPIKPKIYGRVEKEDYTIEKVTFESLPGLFVTGNLYRPKNVEAGKLMPGVLCPHGHWADARFYEAPPGEVKQLLATGAERFETAARNHIQARCVHLARMGCVVFHWDMLGYCDSQQINFDRAHRFANQPAESELKEDGWLLYSPMAESHCQSVPGLQTLASQRAVELLLSLGDVDPKRIAITGASGGGTQAFIGAALDPRISLAFPAVMVSTGMQGGCTCENSCWLRVGTGNVEMAGLIAPRPLGLTAADDWTRTMPKDGFPELQKLYGLFGAEKKVALFPAVHFGHNYNHVSRVAMYGWVSEHFGLGFEKPVLERDFELAQRPVLTVWDAEHPQPPSGEAFERKLMKDFASNVDSVMRGLLKGDRQQQTELKEILQGGWRVCLGLTAFNLEVAKAEQGTAGAWSLASAADGKWSVQELAGAQPSTLNISLTEKSEPSKVTATLAVVLEGSTLDGANLVAPREQALVSNPRLAAAYTYAYNLPLFSKRARQLGATIAWMTAQYPDKQIAIHASGADAALAAAGVACAERLNKGALANVSLQLDVAGFRFAKAASIRDPNFLPGAARYWDVPGLVACLQTPAIVKDVSQAEFDELKLLAKE